MGKSTELRISSLRDCFFFCSKAYIFFYFEVDSFVLIVQPREITFFWYGIYMRHVRDIYETEKDYGPHFEN